MRLLYQIQYILKKDSETKRQMKKEQFLISKQLRLNLLTMQKKMIQLRHRYVIQVVTDNRVDQVKKTFRQFQYFNKILHKRMGLNDNRLVLGKHLRTNNNFKELQLFIQRLNSGYLLFRPAQDLEARRNANMDFFTKTLNSDVTSLQPIKTRQLRNYLFDLLYKQDQLFIEGVDSSSSSSQSSSSKQNPLINVKSLKTQFVKQIQQKPTQKQKSASRNPLKNLFHAKQVDKAMQLVVNNPIGGNITNTLERADVKINQIANLSKSTGQKGSSPGKFRQAIMNLAQKAKNAGQKTLNNISSPQSQPISRNLLSILKQIKQCWIKFPYSYMNRDKNKIYKPYIWQKYEIKIMEGALEFISLSSFVRHRKIFIIFQCDVELNFQNYTKLIVKNKIDKNPLEIRLSLVDNQQKLSEQYLALYTYIKETVKQQQDKLKQGHPNQINSKVCNKVRIRIGLKKKKQVPQQNYNSLPQQYPHLILQNYSSQPQMSDNQYENPQQSINQQINQILNRQNPRNPGLDGANNFSQSRPSQLLVDIDNFQGKMNIRDKFVYKQIKEPSTNIKFVTVRLMHSIIQAFVNLSIDTYVDVEFPILDNYGALDMIVYDDTPKQSILPNIGHTKQTLCSLNVPIQAIYDYMYNTNRPQKRPQIKNRMIQIKNTKINLTFDYKFIGNYLAQCSYNENDVFEDDDPPEQFTRDQFRMNNNRLKRIVWSIELYTDKIKDLKNFTYPNLSYLFYIFLAISCLFYDNNNFLFWILVSMLIILIYNSPAYDLYVRDLVGYLKLKAKKKDLDTILFKKNKIIQEQYVVPMKKSAKIQFLQQFQLTRKVKRSIYKKYKRLLQVLLQVQILLTKIVSILEKIKNIFIWHHYDKTKLLFMLIAGLVFTLMVVPNRFVMFLLVIKMMKKGSKYHSKVQDINKLIMIQLVRIILRENNLNTMQIYFKEIYRPFQFKNPQTFTFFRLCKQSISQWLQVNIDIEGVIRRSTNMTQFLTNLSKCKTKYTIKKEVCQMYGFNLEWAKNQSSLKKYFDLIYGFIVSVPSDKYIIGVKTVAGDDAEEMDEVDNIIDRQLLNF